MERMRLRPNRVLVLLGVAMLAALWGLDAASVAPNRIVESTGYPLWQAVGWPGAGLATLLLMAMVWLSVWPVSHRYPALLVLVTLLALLMPFGLMLAAHRLIEADAGAARLGIGPACWVVLFLLTLCLIELRLATGLARGWMAALLAGIAGVWLMCAALWLEPLALVREFHARSALFYRALWEHLILVGVAVGASVVLGVALGLLIRRYRACQPAAFAVLNFLQTVPSLALFGLLIAPLAWLGAHVGWLGALGVGGIGWAPALLALTIYSLLPVVRNTCVALDAVSPAVLEAARGMGMRPAQRFWRVRLPLALPIMLEGIRVTTVQAIGLAAVAALIGAGGLGDFIFQGLGQAAMDMVLLGALPIVAMALVADVLLGALAGLCRRGEAAGQGDTA